MRSSSELSYRSRVNAVTGHIAANLAEPLDGSILARQAALSPFHFHRVFHELTGLTPAEYVEYARLGAAVVRLRQTDRSVGCVAESVGYESGASLAKAMRRRFGVVPGALRQHDDAQPSGDSNLQRRLDLSAFLRPKPPSRLRPRFVNLPVQRVLWTVEHGMANHHAHDAFLRAECLLDSEAERLGMVPHSCSKMVAVRNAPANPDDTSFEIVVGLPIDNAVPRFEIDPARTYLQLVGGGRYAVFRHLGPRETHWQSWFSIFHNWVPSAAAQLRPGMPFQCGVEEEPGKLSPLLTDIYVPIV